MSAIVVPTSNGLPFTLTFELYKSATLLLVKTTSPTPTI